MPELNYENPTDVIVKAMEVADEMEEVLVIYRAKDDTGVGWVSSIDGTGKKFALMEECKLAIVVKAYGLVQED